MKRIQIITAAALALAAFCGVSGVRAQGGDVRKEINARYQKMIRAFQANQMDTFEQVMDPGYTSTGMGMQMDRPTYMAMMRTERKNTVSIKSVSWTVGRIFNVDREQASVIATLKYDAMSRDPMGQMGPKGAVHHQIYKGSVKDTWVRANNTWLLKSSVDVPGTSAMIVDGKPWSPPGAPAPKKSRKR